MKCIKQHKIVRNLLQFYKDQIKQDNHRTNIKRFRGNIPHRGRSSDIPFPPHKPRDRRPHPNGLIRKPCNLAKM